MTTYCPWLTLSHMPFVHLGFGRKLPSSKQQCSKTTDGFHWGLLAIAATWAHRGTGCWEWQGYCQAAWACTRFWISRAQRYSEVPSWKPEARSCDGHFRGITCPQPMHSCEVPLFSAGQLLSFCKFGPFLLLFKLSFRHKLHSKMFHTSPPRAPPTNRTFSTRWVRNFSWGDGGTSNEIEIHLVLHTHFSKTTCNTEVAVGGAEMLCTRAAILSNYTMFPTVCHYFYFSCDLLPN